MKTSTLVSIIFILVLIVSVLSSAPAEENVRSAPEQSPRCELTCRRLDNGQWTLLDADKLWHLSPRHRFQIEITTSASSIVVVVIDSAGAIGEISWICPASHVTINDNDIHRALVYNRSEVAQSGVWWLLVFEQDDPFYMEKVCYFQHIAYSLNQEWIRDHAEEGDREVVTRLLEDVASRFYSALDVLQSAGEHSPSMMYARPILMHPVLCEYDAGFHTAIAANMTLQKLVASAPNVSNKALVRQRVQMALRDVRVNYPPEVYTTVSQNICESLFYAALIHAGLGDHDEACKMFSELVTTSLETVAECPSADRRSAAQLRILAAANYYLTYGRPDLAKPIMDSALEISSKTITFHKPGIDMRFAYHLFMLLDARCDYLLGKADPGAVLGRTARIQELVEQFTETQVNYQNYCTFLRLLAELHEELGDYASSVKVWRKLAALSVQCFSPENEVHIRTLRYIYGCALRAALVMGELSDAVVYARQLQELEKYGAPKVAVTVQDRLNMVMVHLLLGNVSEARTLLDATVQRASDSSPKVVDASLVRVVRLLDVLRTYAEGPSEALSVVTASVVHTDADLEAFVQNVESAVYIVQALGRSKVAGQSEAMVAVVRAVEKRCENVPQEKSALKKRLLVALAALKAITAQAAAEEGQIEIAASLVRELEKTFLELESDLPAAVQVRVLEARLQTYGKLGSHLQEQWFEELQVAKLKVLIQRSRWAHTGFVDPFIESLRQTESDYALYLLQRQAPAEVAFPLVMARHRMDYRRHLLTAQAPSRHGKTQDAPDAQSHANQARATEALDSEESAASGSWFYAGTAPPSATATYGEFHLLQSVARSVSAAAVQMPVLEDDVRRLQECQFVPPFGSAIVEYVRLTPAHSQPIYVAFVVQNPRSHANRRVRSEGALDRENVDAESEPHLDWLAIADAERIDDAVHAWREAIEQGSQAMAARQYLREKLWEPVERLLADGTHRVYLVPDGPLCQLPWCALPGRRTQTRLLDDYALALLPYAAYMADRISGQRPPLAARAYGRFLLVGAVDYDRRPLPSNGQFATPQPDPGSVRWPALPYTATELDAIASLLPDVPTVRLMGARATSENVLAELARANWAHLATHGFFADTSEHIVQADAAVADRLRFAQRDPLVLSGLVLAGANLGPAQNLLGLPLDESGLITARTIAERPLSHVDMVVLSACQTAAGRAVGDGTVGLQRAFHLAGAENVVATLWRVDDRTTALLMRLFYSYVFHDGLPPIEALRRAQRVFRSTPEQVTALAMLRGPDFTQAVRHISEAPRHSDTEPAERLWAGLVLSGPGL